MEQYVQDLEFQEPAQESIENAESKPDCKQDSEDEYFLPPEPDTPKKHRFQCNICDKILSAKQNLQIHALTHEDPTNRQTFRCEICEGTFKSRVGLKYHLKTRHIAENEREKLPCPTCGRIFKSEEGRKIHMTIQHGAGGPIFKCKECPMVFARKPHLNLHMATHGAGLHVCKICGKSYARLKDLSRHEATCGVQDLCCPLCGKQLRTEQALENHRKKCRSNGLKSEVGLGEKRVRPKKSDSGGEEGKVRMRRSKNDLFLGLEHLADPSTLIEQEKPVEVKPKQAGPPARKTFSCEHCPRKFASKIAALNHDQRQHWEVLGLEGPAPERRGRKRTYPVGHVRKRIRKRKRMLVNYVDPEELLEEDECDAKAEEVDPVKLEDTAQGDPMLGDPVELVDLSETIEPVENLVVQNVVYVEEKFEPTDKIEAPTPDSLSVNETDIKEEFIEFGEYEFDHFENDSADDNGPVEEDMFEHVEADLLVPEGSTSAELDTLAVEPAVDPQVCKELVIRLEKLDYFTLVEPSSNKNDNGPVEEDMFEHVEADLLVPEGSTSAELDTLAVEPAVDLQVCKELVIRLEKLDYFTLVEPSSNKKRSGSGRLKTSLPPSYRCEECGKSFHLEYTLRDHKRNVHGIAEAGKCSKPELLPACCKHCGKKLRRWRNLVYHMNHVHGETVDKSQLFKCPTCPTRFFSEEELQEHVCQRQKRSFKCDLCSRTYISRAILESHYSVHPEYHNFKCDQCTKGFYNESTLKFHQKYSHSTQAKKIRPFKPRYKNQLPRVECEQCGQTFAYQYRLAQHRVKEHGSTETPLPPSYRCEECGKSYQLEYTLRDHKLNVHGIAEAGECADVHSCKHCGKKLIRWRNLVNHLNNVHGETIDKSQLFKCPTCPTRFFSEEELQEHVCHRKKRSFKCDLCSRTYISRAILESHYSVHPEYHNFKCDQCPKGFYNESTLIFHRKHSHSTQAKKIRPFKSKYKNPFPRVECELCGQTFAYQYRLAQHRVKEHGSTETPKKSATLKTSLPSSYRCEECGKSYLLEYKLRDHKLNVHGIAEAGKCADVHSCKHCGKKLIRWRNLVKHLKIFHGEIVDISQLFKCPKCPTRFFSEEELQEHVCSKQKVREPKERSFKCDLCSRTYISRAILESHYSVHPEYHNFKCDQCTKGFYNESTLKFHQKYSHSTQAKKIRPFKSKYKNPFPRVECEQCGQTFAYQYRLAQHRVKEHGSTETPVTNSRTPKMTLSRNYHCDQCDKSYHLQINLTIHKAKVHGVGEVPPKEESIPKRTCKHCKKQFIGWNGLVYHLKFIHGETIDETSRCPSCRTKFTSEEEMQGHLCLKGIIRERERAFKCNLCDNAYFNRFALETHLSMHPEYQNFKCDQCPKGFYVERDLKSHKKNMHKGKESYIECKTCHKLFKNLQCLKRHQELHSDHEFCCEHCGIKFKTKVNLSSHLSRVHNAPRMIICTICGKSIKQRSFNLHMRVHRNDRRFKCQTCGKRFLTNNELYKHQQSHTKDYRFKCKFCEYGTVSRKTIQHHEIQQHQHNRFAEVKD